MVTLRNNQTRRQIIELPHQYVCTEDECLCVKTVLGGRTHDPVTGEIGRRSEEVLLPSSVHIPPKSTSQALPDGVLEIPAVADAIRRGLLIAD